jgi:uncharacterized membrane protein YkoI
MNEKLSRLLVLVGVMLTVLTVVAFALVASVPEDNSKQLTKEELTAMETNNTTNSSINKTKNIKSIISPAEAQEIAGKFIKEPGATAGIPKWDELDGEVVYIVPVVINGTNVGEITINALTGENMGGAGGAP